MVKSQMFGILYHIVYEVLQSCCHNSGSRYVKIVTKFEMDHDLGIKKKQDSFRQYFLPSIAECCMY